MEYPGRIIRWGAKGPVVREVQRKVGTDVDGIFGPNTDRAVRSWQRRHGLLADGEVGPKTWAAIFGGTIIHEVPRKADSLGERAFRIAVSQVGVVESGGNNQGVPLERYIRPNGGVGPEPWCGDFIAYCYRRAGSRTVERLWASVYFLGIVGPVKVDNPRRGEIVRFDFYLGNGRTDYTHTEMFDRWLDKSRGIFLTIGGNTGKDNAVSDSTSGIDGVHRRQRYASNVIDFRRVKH